MARTLPNLGLAAFFALGEDGWDDEMSLNLLKLSVLTQGNVISTVSATPGAPADGDVHIFDGTHPTQANKVAIRDDGAWIYLTPVEGWMLYDKTANQFMKFDGASWAELATGGGGGGVGPVEVSGQAASYTAVIGDANDYIRMNVAGANTFTVPANASVAFPVGTRLYVEQRGAGVTTITPDSGVTIRCRGGIYTTAGQYAVVALIKVDTDTWVLSGDVG